MYETTVFLSQGNITQIKGPKNRPLNPVEKNRWQAKWFSTFFALITIKNIMRHI